MLRFAPGAPGGFRVSTIAVLFVLLMAAAALPIATHSLPPLSDYPNHLARMHVIDAVGADPYLSRFYTVEWQLIPNLMMDLIIPLLHRFMDVYLAGQIFTVLAFVLIGSGTLAFNRALTGRWSALPLIALPLLYNGVLLVGVMNYVFGIGLALWALAAWVALRERAWPWRFAVSVLFALALYVCHLFALGLYGLGLLALEVHRLWRMRSEPWLPRLARILCDRPAFHPAARTAALEPDLARRRRRGLLGIDRQARRPVRRGQRLLSGGRRCAGRGCRARGNLCARAAARSAFIRPAGPSSASASSPIWRCRALCSAPISPTSGCRSRSPSC